MADSAPPIPLFSCPLPEFLARCGSPWPPGAGQLSPSPDRLNILGGGNNVKIIHTMQIQPDLNIDSYLNLSVVHPGTCSPIFPSPRPTLQDPELESEILPPLSQKHHASTLESEPSCSQGKLHGQSATAKYREKRKKYITQLEEQVRGLEAEATLVDRQVKEVKDAILQQLETSIKAMHGSENSEIFGELEQCLKVAVDEHLLDLDKINLLLNTLKFRIGPSGRERQAKIDYNFKNIIHTLFPGLHRYMMICAKQRLDLFSDEQDRKMLWTNELYGKLSLNQEQLEKIQNEQEKFENMHADTQRKIAHLREIKLRMKEEALKVDGIEDELRQSISPVQSAKWTLFCEKYKYRKDISLDAKFKDKGAGTQIEDEMEELLQFKLGRKMPKRQRPPAWSHI